MNATTSPASVALVVDFETTGTDANTDAVTDVGALLLHWTPDGDWWTSTQFGAFADPGRDIPEPVQRLTGIRPEMCAGATPPWAFVRRLADRAQVITSWKIDFDRPLFLRHVGDTGHPWVCSMGHIDWLALGAPDRKLVTVAATVGRFVNPQQHRALADCVTTAQLIGPRMGQLVERGMAPEVECSAYGAPFESKDALKARGYGWDDKARVWRKTITVAEQPAEEAWLAEHVYGGRCRAEFVHLTKPWEAREAAPC